MASNERPIDAATFRDMLSKHLNDMKLIRSTSTLLYNSTTQLLAILKGAYSVVPEYNSFAAEWNTKNQNTTVQNLYNLLTKYSTPEQAPINADLSPEKDPLKGVTLPTDLLINADPPPQSIRDVDTQQHDNLNTGVVSNAETQTRVSILRTDLEQTPINADPPKQDILVGVVETQQYNYYDFPTDNAEDITMLSLELVPKTTILEWVRGFMPSWWSFGSIKTSPSSNVQAETYLNPTAVIYSKPQVPEVRPDEASETKSINSGTTSENQSEESGSDEEGVKPEISQSESKKADTFEDAVGANGNLSTVTLHSLFCECATDDEECDEMRGLSYQKQLALHADRRNDNPGQNTRNLDELVSFVLAQLE